MPEIKVIHVEFESIEDRDETKHYYFGSLASIYEMFTKEEVGIAYSSLRNYPLSFSNPYVNKKCIIRKGILIQKNTKRNSKQ